MRRLVIDAEMLLGWFAADGAGRELRDEYEAGALTVVAPRGIVADALALLARRPGWTPERLERAAVELGRLGIEVHDPPAGELARWIARGLSADRAAYAAVAAVLDLRLATDDPTLRETAATLATGQ